MDSFALSAQRRPIAPGLGRAAVPFVSLFGTLCGVGFGRLCTQVSGFVSLSYFGPRSVLCFVVLRRAGFSLSCFGLVFSYVCGVFCFISLSAQRLVLVPPGGKSRI